MIRSTLQDSASIGWVVDTGDGAGVSSKALQLAVYAVNFMIGASPRAGDFDFDGPPTTNLMLLHTGGVLTVYTDWAVRAAIP